MKGFIHRVKSWLLERRRKPQHAAEGAATKAIESSLNAGDWPPTADNYIRLDHARALWEMGDWDGLIQLDAPSLKSHADREKIAVLIGIAYAQMGDQARARATFKKANDWGCSKQVISQALLSSVHNCLGKAAYLARMESRQAIHFQQSIAAGVSTPETAVLGHSREIRQITQLRELLDGQTNRGDIEPQATGRKVQQKLALIDVSAARIAHLQKREIIAASRLRGDTAGRPEVTIIVATCRPEQIEHFLVNTSRQRYREKRLIVVPHFFDQSALQRLETALAASESNFLSSKVIALPDSVVLGDRLNAAIEAASGDYWTKFDDDDIYYENYLPDAMACIENGHYDLVGKCEHFVHLAEQDMTMLRRFGRRNVRADIICGATFLARISSGLVFGSLPTGEDSALLAQARSKKLKIFATDPFNYVMMRKADPNSHTWKVTKEHFVETAVPIGNGVFEHVARA